MQKRQEYHNRLSNSKGIRSHVRRTRLVSARELGATASSPSCKFQKLRGKSAPTETAPRQNQHVPIPQRTARTSSIYGPSTPQSHRSSFPPTYTRQATPRDTNSSIPFYQVPLQAANHYCCNISHNAIVIDVWEEVPRPVHTTPESATTEREPKTIPAPASKNAET